MKKIIERNYKMKHTTILFSVILFVISFTGYSQDELTLSGKQRTSTRLTSGGKIYNVETNIKPTILLRHKLLFPVSQHVYNSQRFSIIARNNIGKVMLNTKLFSFFNAPVKSYNPRINISFTLLKITF